MKILTGLLKGRSITFKASPELRPTADKIRKAIFDMLQGALEEKRVLDLFSGTGALGFEALSAGAASSVFVEKDRRQLKVIRDNAESLGLTDRCEFLSSDALRAIETFSRSADYFDFIFIDPPYDEGLALRALTVLERSACVHQETLLFAETRRREDLPKRIGSLARIKTREYGDTLISVYRKEVPAPG